MRSEKAKPGRPAALPRVVPCDDAGRLHALCAPLVSAQFDAATARRLPRRDLAAAIRTIVEQAQARENIVLMRIESRDLVTRLLNALLADSETREPEPLTPCDETASDNRIESGTSAGDDRIISAPPPRPPAPPLSLVPETKPEPAVDVDFDIESLLVPAAACNPGSSPIEKAKERVLPVLMERIDIPAASSMARPELARQVGEIVAEILFEERLRLNLAEQRDLVTMLIDDMLGLGPLEPLLADETVTDIMVNGADQVYVERRGKLELTGVRFRDNRHVMNVATRIVTRIGRRVDESTPMVDARLADGSRVNIVVPPLAIDGPSISIRKFAKQSITLDLMARQQNLSSAMASVLKIAARSRLNILISGGTGSGKTTLLNALSQLIDPGERIVTIEDAAELQLQQPHVVRLETRTPNLEGEGEIGMRELLKNALRMRPDRIILGEVRGSEAVDMLQAMNTGHEGSMCTIHANRPREAITRLENMIGMAGINLPAKAVRTQISAAVDLIVQVSRMRDGMRRITSITEVGGMEDDVIITQELFAYRFEGEDAGGKLRGTFDASGLRPVFAPKAAYFGLERPLLQATQVPP
jgi:pilus assembly protein CpaF